MALPLNLIFLITCLFFSSIVARFHGLTKENHVPIVSEISPPPSSSPVSAPVAATPSYSPTREIFNVLSFGAVGDGISDDTQAFEMAWDTACESDFAVVLAPAGYSFLIQPTIFTGPCKMGLVFQIDGAIMPPDGPKSWPRDISKRQWLVFYKVNEMTMQGEGVIEGRGEKWWELPCKPHHNGKHAKTHHGGHCDSPVAMRFFMSSNFTVQGLKVKNSPQFHFRFDDCQNVHVNKLEIKSPALSPNTDGIHIENTNNVHIHDSIVSTGDDCVSIGAGCHNVYIHNTTCGPSHGISIGSLGNHNSRACVSNITVTDSVIKNSDNGARIKTWQGGYGSVSKVTFQNIHMDIVRNPIIIDQYYCPTKDCSNQTSAVYISDITYSYIKGTYDVRSPALHLACSDSVPCSNIILSEIELLPATGEFMANPFCWNAFGATQTLTIPPISCLHDGIPSFVDQNIIDQCE